MKKKKEKEIDPIRKMSAKELRQKLDDLDCLIDQYQYEGDEIIDELKRRKLWK